MIRILIHTYVLYPIFSSIILTVIPGGDWSERLSNNQTRKSRKHIVSIKFDTHPLYPLFQEKLFKKSTQKDALNKRLIYFGKIYRLE